MEGCGDKVGHIQYFRQGNNKDINWVNIISFSQLKSLTYNIIILFHLIHIINWIPSASFSRSFFLRRAKADWKVWWDALLSPPPWSFSAIRTSRSCYCIITQTYGSSWQPTLCGTPIRLWWIFRPSAEQHSNTEGVSIVWHSKTLSSSYL